MLQIIAVHCLIAGTCFSPIPGSGLARYIVFINAVKLIKPMDLWVVLRHLQCLKYFFMDMYFTRIHELCSFYWTMS
jgi:hypothetical protein